LAIPITSLSAELLLIVSFLLLGIWSSTFKLAGNRWRFELFSIDFALGSMILGVVCAYMLTEFGSDLGFTEHLMIASKTNQALAFISGGLFGLGTMLLLAGTALLGIAFSYAIATSSALLVLCVVEFAGYRALFLGVVIFAAFLAMIFGCLGAKSAEATLPAVSLPIMVRKSPSGRTQKAAKGDIGMRNSSRGIIVSILGGMALGGMVSPFFTSVFSQFGLGTFAGVVIFFSGALAATFCLGFLLMNIPIHGGPTTIKAYLRGTIGQHLLGFIGGAMCATGVLLITMLNGFPVDLKPDPLWLWTVGLGAALLAMALGLSKWRELTEASGSATRSLIIGAFLLVLAIGVFALTMDRPAPLPSITSQAGSPHTQLPG
jgi:hypothetical protein